MTEFIYTYKKDVEEKYKVSPCPCCGGREMTDFEKLVLDMRDAQKRYFKTRSNDALEKAKAYERMVDLYLDDIRKQEQSEQDAKQLRLDLGAYDE
jgi:hypothetical protein